MIPIEHRVEAFEAWATKVGPVLDLTTFAEKLGFARPKAEWRGFSYADPTTSYAFAAWNAAQGWALQQDASTP